MEMSVLSQKSTNPLISGLLIVATCTMITDVRKKVGKMGSVEPILTISGGLGPCSDKSDMLLLLLLFLMLQLRPRVLVLVLVTCTVS